MALCAYMLWVFLLDSPHFAVHTLLALYSEVSNLELQDDEFIQCSKASKIKLYNVLKRVLSPVANFTLK